jgi:ABC-2 type transport system permease protein
MPMHTPTPTPAPAAPAREPVASEQGRSLATRDGAGSVQDPGPAARGERGAHGSGRVAHVDTSVRGGSSGTLKAGVALVLRSLSQSLKPLIAVGLVLIALQVVLVVTASAQQQAQAFNRIAEMLPAFMRRTLGDLTLVAVSFQGAVSGGYLHPVIVLLVSFLGIYFGSEPAHDVEAGAVDLVLARPLRRHWLITRSIALIALTTGGAPALMAIAMRLALPVFAPADAPWPAIGQVVKLSLNLAAVAMAMGTISLAIASQAKRRGTAIAAAGVIAVFFYLVMFLEPTWPPAQTIGWLSPFHYFRPLNILAGRGEPWRDLLVLFSIISLLSATAYWQFSRRDL